MELACVVPSKPAEQQLPATTADLHPDAASARASDHAAGFDCMDLVTDQEQGKNVCDDDVAVVVLQEEDQDFPGDMLQSMGEAGYNVQTTMGVPTSPVCESHTAGGPFHALFLSRAAATRSTEDTTMENAAAGASPTSLLQQQQLQQHRAATHVARPAQKGSTGSSNGSHNPSPRNQANASPDYAMPSVMSPVAAAPGAGIGQHQHHSMQRRITGDAAQSQLSPAGTTLHQQPRTEFACPAHDASPGTAAVMAAPTPQRPQYHHPHQPQQQQQLQDGVGRAPSPPSSANTAPSSATAVMLRCSGPDSGTPAGPQAVESAAAIAHTRKPAQQHHLNLNSGSAQHPEGSGLNGGHMESTMPQHMPPQRPGVDAMLPHQGSGTGHAPMPQRVAAQGPAGYYGHSHAGYHRQQQQQYMQQRNAPQLQAIFSGSHQAYQQHHVQQQQFQQCYPPQQQQQRQGMYHTQPQPLAPDVGHAGMPDLSQQYYTLAQQQQILREKLNSLQQQEQMLMQRQQAASTSPAAQFPTPSAAAAGGGGQFDPQMLAAWQSFTSDCDTEPSRVPTIDLCTPPQTAAAAAAQPLALQQQGSRPGSAAVVVAPQPEAVTSGQPDRPAAAVSADPEQDASPCKDQQKQQQQQQRPVTDSPGMVDSSGGGSSDSSSVNKQQVAQVVAKMVDVVVAMSTKMNATAAAEDALAAAAVTCTAPPSQQDDELTSSGDNDQADVPPGPAGWTDCTNKQQQPDCPDQPGSATARTAARPAVADSYSPMIPTNRRLALHSSTDSLSAGAGAAGAADSRGAKLSGRPGPQGPSTMPPSGAPSGPSGLAPQAQPGTCMLDMLDFGDDLSQGGIMLEDLLDFGSPVAGSGPAAAAARDMQQQQQAAAADCNRRPSWSTGAAEVVPQQQWQQQQPQQQVTCGFAPAAAPPNGAPLQAAHRGTAGVAQQSSLMQHRSVPSGGHHGGWNPPGRPTVTTAANPSFHGSSSPHVVSTYQQPVSHTQEQHYMPGSGSHGMPGQHHSGAGGLFGEGGQLLRGYQPYAQHQGVPQHCQHNPHAAGADSGGMYGPGVRMSSMGSCPPDMPSSMAAAQAGSGFHIDFPQQQQPVVPSHSMQSTGLEHYQHQQQQQHMPLPPGGLHGMHSWSGPPSNSMMHHSGDDHAVNAQLDSIMSELHASHSMYAGPGRHAGDSHGVQGMVPQYRGSHLVDSSLGPSHAGMQHQSRSVVTTQPPIPHLHHQQQQHPHMQMQQQSRVDSPFCSPQAQRVQYGSLELSGRSGPSDHCQAEPPGLSEPYHSMGPGLHQSHSMSHPHSYPNHGLQMPPQQQQQQHHMHAPPAGFSSLHRVGSAPVVPSTLNMQASAPGSHAMPPLAYSSSVPQGNMLNPVHSAGFGSYPQQPTHAGSMGLGGDIGFNNAGFGSSGDQRQGTLGTAPGNSQPVTKLKLKVQVQPVKRGRGRPPSRARLAAREVELVPVEVPVAEAPSMTPPVPELTWHERQEMQRAAQMRSMQVGVQSQGSLPLQHGMSGGLDPTYSSGMMYNVPGATGTSSLGTSSYGVGAMSGVASGNGSGSLGGGGGASSSSQQLQRKRSGNISGLDTVVKPGKSQKLERSPSLGSDKSPHAQSSNSSGSGGPSSCASIPRKKSAGMPVPIVRNGVMIPPPAGPEMTARGKPTFADLVQAGAFPPGTYEFSVGTVQSVIAAVASSGAITYGDEQYQSISSFALAAARSRNPNRQACDGWKEVRLRGQKLELWRQAFLNKQPPPAIPAGCQKDS